MRAKDPPGAASHGRRTERPAERGCVGSLLPAGAILLSFGWGVNEALREDLALKQSGHLL